MPPKTHAWNRSTHLQIVLARQREAARRRGNAARAKEDYQDPVYRAAITERRRLKRANKST